ICSMSASTERFPLRAGSLIWRQISRSVLPSHPISRGARCQIGLPGTPAASKLACRWQIGQRIAGRPKSSAPRSTGGWWRRPCSPWRGRSPAGWQFTQRGFVNTFPSSTNIAADRAAGSAIEAKLSGVARLSDWSETASASGVPVSRATSATRTLIRISSPITTSLASRARGQPSRWSRPELRSTPREITSWIGQNHVAHGLVIFDVAGAAAQVSVECLGNGLLEFGPRHRIALQTLEQHLAFVQKARGTVAALEGKVRDKRLLQRRQFAVLGKAFNRADRLAVEAHRRNDAGGPGVARAVGIIDDDRAAQALRGAAAELGTGHPEILAQEIIHRQFVAHLARAVSASIDRDGQHRHLSTPLIMAWVTGKDRKR